MKILISIVMYILYMNTYFWIYKNVYNNNIEKNNKIRQILFITCTAALVVILELNKLVIIKTLLMPLIILLGIKYLYNKLNIKTLGITFLMIFCTGFAELLFITVAVNIFRIDNTIFINDIKALLIANVSIYIITVFLLLLKNIKKYIININKFSKKEGNQFLFFIIGIIIVLYIGYYNFGHISFSFNCILVNIFFIAIYVYIVEYYKEKNTNIKLSKNYEELFEYTKTFEKLVKEKNMQYHEYNNQLAMIKEMSNIKTKKYINNILKGFAETKEKVIYDNLINISSSAIKGFIYYKLLKMKNQNLKISIMISNEVNQKKYWKFNEEQSLKLSEILGILFDNASEASLLSNEKEITLQIYLENKSLVFEIGNTFDKEELELYLDQNKSTKDICRGNGLKILDKIIKQENITIENSIINNFFIKKIKF